MVDKKRSSGGQEGSHLWTERGVVVVRKKGHGVQK